jgi:drug/metabolite transporter (DMT)-like permease
MNLRKIKLKENSKYLLLYFALLVYSCCSICNKLAAGYPILSWGFILFYAMGIFVLGIYAVLWQIVLKQFELSVAYSNKPLTTLLSMIWGVALFGEPISWNMLVGAAIILIGIRVVVSEHGK